LEGDEVDMHGMGERDGAKHGVDKVPVLCRSDPWIFACSAFAEFIVPVDEEVELAVSTVHTARILSATSISKGVCYRTTTFWMIFLISFSTFLFSNCSRYFL
jgi:hypothetical protein